MGGQSIVYVHNIDDPFFYLLRLFTKGGWVIKKGQNSVYVVVEWPLGILQYIFSLIGNFRFLLITLDDILQKRQISFSTKLPKNSDIISKWTDLKD